MNYEHENETLKDLSKDKITVEVSFSPIYARVFDSTNPNWNTSKLYNQQFIKQAELFANQLLKTKGYIILNDVYDLLCLSHTKAGAVTGWVYKKDDMTRDNFIEFNVVSLSDSSNQFIIDFNVDGVILDYIPEES